MTPALFDDAPEIAPRWGVYCRRRPAGRWAVVASAGTEDDARKLMLRLMDSHRGHTDWSVRRIAADGNRERSGTAARAAAVTASYARAKRNGRPGVRM